MNFYDDISRQYDQMNGMGQYPNPMASYQPMIADEKVLIMLEEGMKDQKQAVEYYKKVMVMVPDPTGRKIVDEIRIDKMKHYKMFREVYQKASGKRPNYISSESMPCSEEVEKEIEKSIFKELDSVEFYRTIYFLLMNPEFRDMMYEIITDVQEHATKFTYLYAKYKK